MAAAKEPTVLDILKQMHEDDELHMQPLEAILPKVGLEKRSAELADALGSIGHTIFAFKLNGTDDTTIVVNASRPVPTFSSTNSPVDLSQAYWDKLKPYHTVNRLHGMHTTEMLDKLEAKAFTKIVRERLLREGYVEFTTSFHPTGMTERRRVKVIAKVGDDITKWLLQTSDNDPSEITPEPEPAA